MIIIQIYIGIVYENEKKIAFSYQTQSLNGNIISSEDRIIKQQGLENFTSYIIKKTLEENNKYKNQYIGIYTDCHNIVNYINRLINNCNYEHIKQIKYQPKGKLFKLLKNYNVKFIICTSPRSEIFTLVKQRAINLIK